MELLAVGLSHCDYVLLSSEYLNLKIIGLFTIVKWYIKILVTHKGCPYYFVKFNYIFLKFTVRNKGKIKLYPSVKMLPEFFYAAFNPIPPSTICFKIGLMSSGGPHNSH